MFAFFKLKSMYSRLAGILAGVAIAVCASGTAVAQAPGKIPDLGSSSSFGWTPLTVNGGIARYGTAGSTRPQACEARSSRIPIIRCGAMKPAGRRRRSATGKTRS